MKYFFAIFLLVLLLAVTFSPGGAFLVQTQPELGMKQWLFILLTFASFAVLFVLQLRNKNTYSLYFFFLVYPFLSQTAYYVNFASSFFILTPAFIYLLLYLFLSKSYPPNRIFVALILFCLSTIISIFFSVNQYTAWSFFVLGVGGFALAAYVIYSAIIIAPEPVAFIKKIIFSIFIGVFIYLAIETVSFRIQPGDIFKIITRNFYGLSSARYYTGGYREPAGLGFIVSTFFWVIYFFLTTKRTEQSRPLDIFLTRGMFLGGIILLIIVGTRSALLNVVNIFIITWLLGKRTKVRDIIHIKKIYLIVLVIAVGVGAYLLIPRTIKTSRSRPTAAWIQPTYISIAGYTFEIVGTTPYYFQRSTATWQDFVNNPQGTGPFNATLTEFEALRNKTGPSYHFFLPSNLIVTGATFGWLSLALWIVFTVYAARKTFTLHYNDEKQIQYKLLLLLLAVFIASFLPGSYYIGPHLNWASFDRSLPLSADIAGIPADYPSIISGLLLGMLIGLFHRISKQDALHESAR